MIRFDCLQHTQNDLIDIMRRPSEYTKYMIASLSPYNRKYCYILNISNTTISILKQMRLSNNLIGRFVYSMITKMEKQLFITYQQQGDINILGKKIIDRCQEIINIIQQITGDDYVILMQTFPQDKVEKYRERILYEFTRHIRVPLQPIPLQPVPLSESVFLQTDNTINIVAAAA